MSELSLGFISLAAIPYGFVCLGQQFRNWFIWADSPWMSCAGETLMGTPGGGTTSLSPSLLVALGFGLSSLPLSPAGLASCFLLPFPRASGSSEEQRGAVRVFAEPSCSQTSLPPMGCGVGER